MSTTTTTLPQAPAKPRTLVDMNWDPITRIVGSLGIYTKLISPTRRSPSVIRPPRSFAAIASS